MSASEIKSFEDLWKYLWSIFYAILDFFRGALEKPEVNIGTNPVKFDSVSDVYPTK